MRRSGVHLDHTIQQMATTANMLHDNPRACYSGTTMASRPAPRFQCPLNWQWRLAVPFSIHCALFVMVVMGAGHAYKVDAHLQKAVYDDRG
jgi:hypothetical protein